jgi:trigger factor
MYAKTESVSRPIQMGDFVMIDLKGVKAKSAGDESPAIDRPGLPVFVRDGEKDDEFPFKGFSKELVGMNMDESKSFNHKYEKAYKDENLQGLSVNFDLKVKMVRGSILPDLNDEFAKQVGPFENLQALQEAVKANLATQSKAEYDDNYFANLIEKIKEKAVIKFPPQVLDHELKHVMEDLKSRLGNQGMDMAAYLKSRQMDEKKFVSEEASPIAVKRLERSLIMDELAKNEKIEVSRDILQSSFEQTWGEYQSDAGFQKTMRGKSKPPKQLMNDVAMESANRAYVQQTLNRMKDIATGQAPDLQMEIDTKKPVAKKMSKGASKKATKTAGVKVIGEKKAALKATSSEDKKSIANSKKTASTTSSPKGKNSATEK